MDLGLGNRIDLKRQLLPTSLQLLGRPFWEATLLAIGERYQRETDWHRRRPPLAS